MTESRPRALLFALAVLGLAAVLLAAGCSGSSPGAAFSSDAYLRTPAWSPDGRRLAFVRFLNGYNEIYAMNADGSHLRRLTSARQDLIVELSSQAWSPDGSELVFARGPNTSTPGENTSIFVMNTDRTRTRRLTQNHADDVPAWSPKGRQIAFARSGFVYVMNSDGTNQHQVAESGGDPTPAWSPDGKELAIEDYEAISIVKLDGHLVRRLPAGKWNGYTTDAYEPTWSPDGKRLAFVSDVGSDAPKWIEVRSAGGGGRRVLARGGDHAVEYPAWSPNGGQIAYDVTGTLMVMNADGSGAHQLTPK
jgi:Tol biopolymer transport system component